MIERFIKAFDNTPINDKVSRGSNDPFIVFGYNEIRKLPHWKDCIKRGES